MCESWRKVDLIVAACTWQGSEEGRQHQLEGKEDKESEGNRLLVTIITTYYCFAVADSA